MCIFQPGSPNNISYANDAIVKLKIGTPLLVQQQIYISTFFFFSHYFPFFFFFSDLGSNSGYHIAFNSIDFTFQILFSSTYQPRLVGSCED